MFENESLYSSSKSRISVCFVLVNIVIIDYADPATLLCKTLEWLHLD